MAKPTFARSDTLHRRLVSFCALFVVLAASFDPSIGLLVSWVVTEKLAAL